MTARKSSVLTIGISLLLATLASAQTGSQSGSSGTGTAGSQSSSGASSGSSLTPGGVQALFRRFDTNGDGQISQSEFTANAAILQGSVTGTPPSGSGASGTTQPGGAGTSTPGSTGSSGSSR